MLLFAVHNASSFGALPRTSAGVTICHVRSGSFTIRTLSPRAKQAGPKTRSTTLKAVWDTVATDLANILGGALLPHSLLGQTGPGVVINEVAAAAAGGTVGVMGTLTALEVVKQQAKERKQCPYCRGTGQLPCGRCFTIGRIPSAEELCGDAACEHCVQRGFTPCNHCEGTGRLIPIEYERALQAQFEDYDFSSAYHEEYYIDGGPPFR